MSRALSLVVLSLVFGCTDGHTKAPDPGAGGSSPGPEGQSGAADAPGGGGEAAVGAPTADPGPGEFQADFAESGAFFTKMTTPMKGLSSSPHGYVQIFYSNNIQALIELPPFEVPVGTVAIKRQSSKDDGTVDALTVMIKGEPGSSPDTLDWLFESRKPNGALGTSGGASQQFCADCHARWPETSNLAGTALAN
jgi:hypothetical protein